MGSCFSKSASEEKGIDTKLTTSKNRFEKSNQKLGSTNTVQQNINTRASRNIQPHSNNQEPGRKLGESANFTNPISGREAAAKAAEDRFVQKQQEIKESSEKLKAASKMSKADKKL